MIERLSTVIGALLVYSCDTSNDQTLCAHDVRRLRRGPRGINFVLPGVLAELLMWIGPAVVLGCRTILDNGK